MKLADLPPPGNNLMLLVLGPGTGESVVVYWPPDHWLVVDSFRRGTGASENHPAVDVLRMFDAYADAVALTHPHEDHTGGFPTLIERRKPGGFVGWWATMPAALEQKTANAAQALRVRSNEAAVAAILRAWNDEPACRWELYGEAPAAHIGSAQIQVLAPLADTVAHNQGHKTPSYNEMSSAMLLTWEGCTLLLGADLVNIRGWDAVATRHGALAFATTTAMKVAHHGSKEAQHPVALGHPPATDRVHLATPFKSKKVPNYGSGRDVELLLGVANRLYLSSHHGPRPTNSATHDMRRSDLQPAVTALGPLDFALNGETAAIEDCWVAASWDAAGQMAFLHRGEGSLSVIA